MIKNHFNEIYSIFLNFFHNHLNLFIHKTYIKRVIKILRFNYQLLNTYLNYIYTTLLLCSFNHKKRFESFLHKIQIFYYIVILLHSLHK